MTPLFLICTKLPQQALWHHFSDCRNTRNTWRHIFYKSKRSGGRGIGENPLEDYSLLLFGCNSCLQSARPAASLEVQSRKWFMDCMARKTRGTIKATAWSPSPGEAEGLTEEHKGKDTNCALGKTSLMRQTSLGLTPLFLGCLLYAWANMLHYSGC